MKVPKPNKTSTNTYPDCLSAIKGGNEREVCPLPSRLLSECNSQVKIIYSQAPKTINQTHLTLPLSGNDQSPSDAIIRIGSERGFSATGLSLSQPIDRVDLTAVSAL